MSKKNEDVFKRLLEHEEEFLLRRATRDLEMRKNKRHL